jgi:hypothetical protein
MATTQVTTTPLMLVEVSQNCSYVMSLRSGRGKTGVRRRHSRLRSGLPQHTSPRHVDLDGLAHTTRARSAHTSTSDYHTYSANALLRVLHAHRTVRVLGPATALSYVPTRRLSAPSYEAALERLASAWNDTPTKWYPLPLGAGAVLLLGMHIRKSWTGSAMGEGDTLGKEVHVDENGREIVRLKGPWQVSNTCAYCDSV